MDKKSVVALLTGLIVGQIPGQIGRAEQPVVLTPTKLYDFIEELQKKQAKQEERNSKTLQALLEANQRIQKLEESDRKLTELLARHEMRLKNRVGELERKVAGVQHQVTVLHAKARALEAKQ